MVTVAELSRLPRHLRYIVVVTRNPCQCLREEHSSSSFLTARGAPILFLPYWFHVSNFTFKLIVFLFNDSTFNLLVYSFNFQVSGSVLIETALVGGMASLGRHHIVANHDRTLRGLGT